MEITLISVVIPTFNRREYVEKLVLQLKKQKEVGFNLKIIVVIDGSSDGTIELLSQMHPEVFMVNGTGDWWYTKSMNMGFIKAMEFNSDYILTLNDDVEIPDDYIKTIFDSTKTVKPNSIIGSLSVSISEKSLITFSGVKSINWWRYKQTHYIKPYSPYSSDIKGVKASVVLPGRGMLIPSKVLKEMSFFDEKFPQYASDDDFCLRASKKGYKVFVCWDAIVYSHTKLTGTGSPLHNQNILHFTKSFFNKYSPLSISKDLRMVFRHGNRLLALITISIILLGNYKAFFYYKKIKNNL